jgi:hypothetical protein
MKKKMLSLILVLALVCAAAVTANAVDVPDMSQKGTINIIMHKGEDLISGGTLTLYRVGEIHEDDGNYSFIPTGAFVNCVEEFEDVQSPALAQQLAAFAAEQKLIGNTEAVGDDGLATFVDLELGLYLVVQHTPAPGYSEAEPFLIGVPQMENGMYCYDVDASPKVDVDRVPETTDDAFASGDKLPQTGQLFWPIPLLAILGLGLIILGISLKKKSGEA